MRTRPDLMIALALGLFSVEEAAAAGYDGTQPFTCAPTEIVSCVPGGGCEKETVAEINLPSSLTFDLASSKITGTRPDGAVLATTIESTRQLEDALALQGVQGHVLWSITIGKASGKMALAAMGDDTGYIAFGGCTPR